MRERAALGFAGYLLAMAVVCGAVIVSGWFAGVLDDPAERVFWAGAILAGLTVAILAAAVFPGWKDEAREERRVRWTLRAGLTTGMLAPGLCLTGLIADFFG
jgi:hypothetical protein